VYGVPAAEFATRVNDVVHAVRHAARPQPSPRFF
jgi:hypothetical protein